jgi:plastocyanin
VTVAPPGRGATARKALAAAAALMAAMPAFPVGAEGRAHRVEMRDVAFAPARITVRAGDSVAWRNGDIVAHTATSEEGGFDVDVPPGGDGSAVMVRPGRFAYTCRYHPNMAGQIVVEP